MDLGTNIMTIMGLLLASYSIISAFMDLNGIRLRRTKVDSRVLGKKKNKNRKEEK
ncbi:hypothetical protein ACOJIU_18875 (plasmid) [Carnobacterium maltaromaticum]|uniref:hypothetical protein n=1 Tax=Carnobacterium maltaromaticum TaxID=2751 RepID=UPI00344D3727